MHMVSVLKQGEPIQRGGLFELLDDLGLAATGEHGDRVDDRGVLR